MQHAHLIRIYFWNTIHLVLTGLTTAICGEIDDGLTAFGGYVLCTGLPRPVYHSAPSPRPASSMLTLHSLLTDYPPLATKHPPSPNLLVKLGNIWLKARQTASISMARDCNCYVGSGWEKSGITPSGRWFQPGLDRSSRSTKSRPLAIIKAELKRH